MKIAWDSGERSQKHGRLTTQLTELQLATTILPR